MTLHPITEFPYLWLYRRQILFSVLLVCPFEKEPRRKLFRGFGTWGRGGGGRPRVLEQSPHSIFVGVKQHSVRGLSYNRDIHALNV
jgi:hypothetical protein